MKKLILILTLFLFILNTASADTLKTVRKEYKVTAADGFAINSVLEYPKSKNVMEYKTVILLHSLGYNSEWWSTLPKELLEQGYAVLTVDLRGHGKSVYNSKLAQVSWKSMTNKAFSKYPDDLLIVVNNIKSENKRVFFDNWAIVGVDVGGSAGIGLANKMPVKPKTIVLISPVVNAKGLYTPVKLAELDNVDILSITGRSDVAGKNAQEYLKKFAQAEFVEYTSESKSTGMLMFKSDEELTKIITAWIEQYLK